MNDLPDQHQLPDGARLDGEQWRWVVNADRRWAVSDRGRVCSVNRTTQYKSGQSVKYPARFLTLVPNSGGYLVVSVFRQGKKICRTVHSLVAEAFIGERPSGLGVLHRNGSKTDNRSSNLYYGTAADNALDAIRHGTKVRGATHGMVKVNVATVRHIRSLSGKHKQRDIAKMFGLGQSHVQRIISRQSWAHIED